MQEFLNQRFPELHWRFRDPYGQICFRNFGGFWMGRPSQPDHFLSLFTYWSYILSIIDWKNRFCSWKTIYQSGPFTPSSPPRPPDPQSSPGHLWFHLPGSEAIGCVPHQDFVIESFTACYHIGTTVIGVTWGKDSKEMIKSWQFFGVPQVLGLEIITLLILWWFKSLACHGPPPALFNFSSSFPSYSQCGVLCFVWFHIKYTVFLCWICS